MKPKNLLLIGSSILLLAVTACKEAPYYMPDKEGYAIEDDAKPWFDGKDYLFYSDMFDGKSVKAQEEGSYHDFPLDSVPVQYALGKVQKIYDPFVPIHQRAAMPLNPTKKSKASIANGQMLFNTYCAVCHGATGMGNTPVTRKGMPAPPIGPLLPVLSESHLYNKIKYGSMYPTEKFQMTSGLMPAYGGQTSIKDRWDLVNYMKSSTFGKNAN